MYNKGYGRGSIHGFLLRYYPGNCLVELTIGSKPRFRIAVTTRIRTKYLQNVNQIY
jgi:hypothetical protein